ncbi:16S rRNA (cytosine(1402)-N(4))-methyltransferase RsmH [Patescibacteria group bacterium]|nr:16S rRNA (cytosine(1402)-N(4))-methyltransferase RsmH [Patescibacteria group bacterium]
MHIPVLQKEVLGYLNPEPNENFIDCTLGQTGHTLMILERTGPKGKVLGIDRDSEILRGVKKSCESAGWQAERLRLVCDNFVNLKKIVEKEKFGPISGILFDLGMSSWHLKESGRGFSFKAEEPLDMRYNLDNPLTAEKIINEWPESKIEKILKEYGEERFSKQITRGIARERKLRPIKTTFQLSEIIKKVVPGWYLRRKIHFATKTFQALRIAVNEELENLEKVLPQAVEILEQHGRLALISFHSLEDRIVKNFLRNKAKEGSVKILTKKPITSSREEIKINPSSRSAKLRAAIKINI